MAETPYLVDSNVLLRWVKPDHRDYPAIISATDAVLRHDGVLCYTSQNVGEILECLYSPRGSQWLRPLASRNRPTRKVFRGKAPSAPGQRRGSRGVAQAPGNAQRVWCSSSRRAPSVGNAVHGVKRIPTFNDRDFARYTDIEAVHPRNVSHV